MPGSILSKTNDDTHTLANRKVHSTVCLIERFIAQVSLLVFFERDSVFKSRHRSQLILNYFRGLRQNPEELCNKIIKTDYD